MPSNLFIKMSSQPLMIVRAHDVAASEIHAVQLQQMMMREVLHTDSEDFIANDGILSYLDNSREWSVSAAVALFPAWIFHTNQCAFMDLTTQQLKVFANNCEAMFYGEKFYYNGGCGIDAGAGEANDPRDLLTACVKFNQLQGSEFTEEDIDRFFNAGILSDDDRLDMLAVLADQD